MLRAENLLIEQRPASTVDQILAKGNRLYLYALSLNYLPPVIVRLLFSLRNRYESCQIGVVYVTQETLSDNYCKISTCKQRMQWNKCIIVRSPKFLRLSYVIAQIATITAQIISHPQFNI